MKANVAVPNADTLSAVSARSGGVPYRQSVPGWRMVAFGAKQASFSGGARCDNHAAISGEATDRPRLSMA